EAVGNLLHLRDVDLVARVAGCGRRRALVPPCTALAAVDAPRAGNRRVRLGAGQALDRILRAAATRLKADGTGASDPSDFHFLLSLLEQERVPVRRVATRKPPASHFLH